MHILIVGNVLKDVSLTLDSRTEHFETDAAGTKWLDFSFDASRHHYFSRTSSFGGAAVSLEVLQKLGLDASVNCSDFSFDDSGTKKPSPADAYRYILTADDNVSYLTPTVFQHTNFTAPINTPDYIYIDRSANLDVSVAEQIHSYLDTHPEVGLILHLKKSISPAKNILLRYANLIFSENPDIPELANIDIAKIIFLTESSLTYKNITEPISVDRIDTLTRLSVFTIAATTVLGGFLLGRTVEDSLKLARANVENSTLDSCLTLQELDNLTAIASDSPALLAAAYISSTRGIPKSIIMPAITDSRDLRAAYNNGYRFVNLVHNFPITLSGGKILSPSKDQIDRAVLNYTNNAKDALSANIVPIINVIIPTKGHFTITKSAEVAGMILNNLFSAINAQKISLKDLILSISPIAAGTDFEISTVSDIASATTEILRRHVPKEIAGVVLNINDYPQEKATALFEEISRSGSFSFPISLPPELLPA